MHDPTFRFAYDGKDYGFFGDPKMPFIQKIKSSKTFYEIDFLEYVRSLDLDGAYIDAGCFVGNHSIYFANHCKSTKVFCFDADVLFRDLFVKNTEYNTDVSKLEYEECAIMGDPGWVDLNEHAVPGIIQCTDIKNLEVKDKGAIQAKTLDMLKPTFGSEHIAFIKLDIEGCELQAIKGATELIKEHRPVIAAEAWKHHEQMDLKDLFYKLGYEHIRTLKSGAPMLIFRSK